MLSEFNLEKKEVEKLIRPYKIGKLKSFERLKKGFMNYSFKVLTSKGKFILRIGKKTKEKKDILFEINLLNHLEGLPVPKYLKGSNGKYIHEFKNHNYSVYRYLDGEMPDVCTAKLFSQSAKFLAEFHNQTNNFESVIDRFAWYTFDDDRISQFKKYLIKNLPEHNKEIEYMEKNIRECILPRNLPSGPLHSDLKPENLLVKNGDLSGVVDFDNCQMGPYLLDLAISITWFCTEMKTGLDYEKAKEFVKHYEKIRKLSTGEKKNLFRAIKYAYISHEYADFYIYAEDIISEEYFNFGRKFHLESVKKLDKDEFEEFF